MSSRSIENSFEMKSFDFANFIYKANTLSITAHNTQPFYFKKKSDTNFEICLNKNRDLLIGDPNHKDLKVALGAFLYVLETICGSSNVQLVSTVEKKLSKTHIGQLHFKVLPASSLDAQKCAEYSAILARLQKRFSYRGILSSDIDVRLVEVSLHTLPSANSIRLLPNENKAELAELYDQINMSFLNQSDYLQELYHWLRFSKAHPNWNSDGLNAKAMGLSAIEAIGAKYVLKPSVFNVLSKLKLIAPLVTEKSKNIKDSVLLAIISDSHDPIEWGKIFLKVWAELTDLNLYGNPLSLLTDSPKDRDFIYKSFQIPKNKNLVNIMRVGYLPKDYQRYQSSRLSMGELIQ